MEAVIVALIAAGVPSITTGIVAAMQNRKSSRTSAKQSILIWILHDQVKFEQTGELPTHYEKIHEEYDTYHKNGGNGVITGEVEAYDKWVKEIAKKAKKKGAQK